MISYEGTSGFGKLALLAGTGAGLAGGCPSSLDLMLLTLPKNDVALLNALANCDGLTENEKEF